MSKSVDLWLDLKSPYSFLAKDPAYALERELGVTLRLRPYALDILGAYNVGDPKVAERGLRRIKYLYADVRRFANQRGMTILGPKKIFDSTLIHLAWMFADASGKGRALIDAAYPRFFKRELDYEDRAAVEALMKESETLSKQAQAEIQKTDGSSSISAAFEKLAQANAEVTQLLLQAR